MTIAFASGKGGTGKTSFSVAFALSACGTGKETVTFLDCDVEEPDSHFFLKPVNLTEETVTVSVPEVDKNKCTGCGKCAKACRFNAITMIGEYPLFFHEICHSCGGCSIACPENAINEIQTGTGVISCGEAGRIAFYQGRLDIGNTKSPPLIRAVRKKAGKEDTLVIIDAPPGTSCPMVTALKGADYAVLVTEPTPFGFHDLKLAADTVREIGIPFGVVINKADSAFKKTEDYCKEQSIPVLLKVPEARTAAEGYSIGRPIIDFFPDLPEEINNVIAKIRKEIHQ